MPTRGHGRLATGFQLLEADPGARLLISAVGASVRTGNLAVPPGVESRADLGRISVGAVGNAVERQRWARERGVARAVLVTSDVHLPRSMLVFRHRAPSIEVVPYPVAGPGGGPQDRPIGWYAAAAIEHSKSVVMRTILLVGGLASLTGRA